MDRSSLQTKGDKMSPIEMLKDRITGAIERGEGVPIVEQPERYCKVRFSSKNHHGATAGLIFSATALKGKTISDISRLFPFSEFNKMNRLERSPVFPSWDEAFHYQFIPSNKE